MEEQARLVHQPAAGLQEEVQSGGFHLDPIRPHVPQALRLASLYQPSSFIKALASSDPAHAERAPGNSDRHTHGSHRSVGLFASRVFASLTWIKVEVALSAAIPFIKVANDRVPKREGLICVAMRPSKRRDT